MTLTAPESALRTKVVPIARGLNPDTALVLADALASAGHTTLEITLEGEQGIASIESLAEHELTIGAGTVTSITEADAAASAGAEYLVSPGLNPALISWANTNEIPYIPGVFTPTEVSLAVSLGATTLKIFPATTGGAQHVGALRGPFPEVDLIATGGITASNASDYLRAGARAVGVGDWLTADGQPEIVAKRTAELFAAVGGV